MVKITLDAETFKALASATRLSLMRQLDERRKTLSELARDLELNKATLHEHLALLSAAGLVKKRDDEGRKWIYYELTWTGQKILHPQETTTFNLLLGAGVAAAGGGIAMLGHALGFWFTSKSAAHAESPTAPSSDALIGAGNKNTINPNLAAGIVLDGNDGRGVTGTQGLYSSPSSTSDWRADSDYSGTPDSTAPSGTTDAYSSASSQPTMQSAPSTAPAASTSAAPSSAPMATPAAAPTTSAAPATSTPMATPAPTTSSGVTGGSGGSNGGAAMTTAPPMASSPPQTTASMTSTAPPPATSAPAPAPPSTHAPMPAASHPPAQTVNPLEAGAVHDRDLTVAFAEPVPAAPASSAAVSGATSHSHFVDDGGWIAIALMLVASMCVLLAVLLKRRFRAKPADESSAQVAGDPTESEVAEALAVTEGTTPKAKHEEEAEKNTGPKEGAPDGSEDEPDGATDEPGGPTEDADDAP